MPSSRHIQPLPISRNAEMDKDLARMPGLFNATAQDQSQFIASRFMQVQNAVDCGELEIVGREVSIGRVCIDGASHLNTSKTRQPANCLELAEAKSK